MNMSPLYFQIQFELKINNYIFWATLSLAFFFSCQLLSAAYTRWWKTLDASFGLSRKNLSTTQIEIFSVTDLIYIIDKLCVKFFMKFWSWSFIFVLVLVSESFLYKFP